MDAYKQVDLNITYNINDQFAFGLDGINITGEGQLIYSRTKQMQWWNARRRSALDAHRALQLPVIAQSNGIPAGWRRESSARIIGFPEHPSGNPFFTANPSMAIRS